MVKYDPHNSEGNYKRWRNDLGAPFKGVTDDNAKLLTQFLDDMELGTNVSPGTKKGPRSYIRLRNLKSKVHSWAVIVQKEINVQFLPDLVHHQRELLQLIKKMRDGQVFTRHEKSVPITGVGTMVKAFKSFWHWYQRFNRKAGVVIEDITQDFDGKDPKPQFNYITIDQLNKLCNEARYDYRVLMMFLFDTGIRAPTELMNVKVNDLEWNEAKNHYVLNIRQETSKTFGRRIKLLLCSIVLKEYIENKKIRGDQFIFTTRPQKVNQYLKKLAYRVLKIGEFNGKRKTRTGSYYYSILNGLTLYDFRHSSACYWLVRYKSESALKYRFGWMKSEMIHYYTELLGMKDTIEEDDLYVDVSKTQLERDLNHKGSEICILQEQLKAQEDQIKNQEKQLDIILQTIRALQLEAKTEERSPSKIINEAFATQ